MNSRHEDAKGWLITVAIHLLLLLVLWMIKLPVFSQGPEFLEVSWSAVGTPPISSVHEEPATLDGASTADPYSSRKVQLPERLNLEPPDEVLRVPEMKKLQLSSAPQPERTYIGTRGFGERGKGISFGERGKIEAPVVTGRSKDIKPPFGAAMSGESDRSVGFEVAWTGGGKRRLLSGKLPDYPAGVNLEAQIKIRAVVLPDGRVKSVQPIQKANTRLEEAALKEVRFWKFDPLSSTISQIDQTCTITFNFLLR
ncbi:MAG: TonB family protein [Bacteroidota bacterium]